MWFDSYLLGSGCQFVLLYAVFFSTKMLDDVCMYSYAYFSLKVNSDVRLEANSRGRSLFSGFQAPSQWASCAGKIECN